MEVTAKWRIRREVIMSCGVFLENPENNYSETHTRWTVNHPSGITICVATWERAIEVLREELQRRQAVAGTNM